MAGVIDLRVRLEVTLTGLGVMNLQALLRGRGESKRLLGVLALAGHRKEHLRKWSNSLGESIHSVFCVLCVTCF